jgi:hypothetical protein
VEHKQWSGISAEALDYMGPPQEVIELIEEQGVHWAILALPETKAPDQADLLAAALLFPNLLIVDEASTLPSLWSRTVDIDGCSGRHSHHLSGPLPRHVKRAFDIVAAGVLILCCLPLFVLIAGLIRISSPGSLFYAQERIGRGGRRFRAWKFRTMVPNADRALENYLQAHPELHSEWEQNHKLKNDPRIIPGIGRFLRYYSLDEVPQLWNVLCGDMSLVGPRPTTSRWPRALQASGRFPAATTRHISAASFSTVITFATGRHGSTTTSCSARSRRLYFARGRIEGTKGR